MSTPKKAIERLIHIGLGANLGNAEATIKAAIEHLSAWANRHSVAATFRHSRLYRSASIGADGPDYINAVAEFSSPLNAQTILNELQAIENQFGRTRSTPNAPRTLDLDLLLAGTEIIQLPHLIVPHPRMVERAFVLKPLADLQPQLRLSGRSLNKLLQSCTDQICVPIEEKASLVNPKSLGQ
jgi:2-amino-4-hydroxy-6-hydroxymethyldihydropteridine diphosphokinase